MSSDISFVDRSIDSLAPGPRADALIGFFARLGGYSDDDRYAAALDLSMAFDRAIAAGVPGLEETNAELTAQLPALYDTALQL